MLPLLVLRHLTVIERQHMPKHNSYKTKLLRQHPYCCFCGGTTKSVSIDHMPPRKLFLDGIRPKGLEFPACRRCNEGCSQLDAAIRWLAFSQSPIALSGAGKLGEKYHQHTVNAMKNWANNNTGLGGTFSHTGEQLVQINGIVHRTSTIEIDPVIFENFLDPWAVKQSLALWYWHSNLIFSDQGLIRVFWFAPTRQTEKQQAIKSIPFSFDYYALQQGKWDTSNQFKYQYLVNTEERVGVFEVILHNGVTLISYLMDCQNQEMLEKFANSVNEQLWCTSADAGIHQSEK